jgi:endonuclease YncB( thermonuclease family)
MTRRGAPLATLIAVCLAFSGGALAAELRGRVVGVTDGDTLTLLVPGPREVRVRLVEIDAPERRQPWGQRSRQALASLVFGRDVRVVSSGFDRYGRVLGRVYAGGRDVNAEMVRQGAAWAYREYLTDSRLVALEREARRARRGLWSLPSGDTVPPWAWRRRPAAA